MVIILFKKLIKNIQFLKYRFQYLINYIIIGILAVSFEIIIAKYLLFFININLIIKVIIGFMLSVFLAFYLNAKLNFKVPKEKNTRTFVAFLVISTIAFILNLLLIGILLNQIRISYSVVRFLSAGAIFILSYIAHRKITFDFVKKVGIAIYLNKKESVSEIYSKIKYYADFIHIDLIDKTYNKEAENIDLSIMNEINKTWGLKKFLHIMSKKPSKWIKKLQDKVDVILIHPEINEPLNETISLIKNFNKKVGLVIDSKTQIKEIEKYLSHLNYIQVMGINELGRSGQKLNLESFEKIKELNKIKKNHSFEIIFDGGVKTSNIWKINSKYVVSSSGLLSSEDPIKAFMELKTSSKYSYLDEKIKPELIGMIKNTINSMDFVISGNLVGSFSKGDTLKGISDIDIVIIVDNLTKLKFREILKNFNLLKKEVESKYGYKTLINNTLGPLKFNKDNIVFHLMLYDLKSHEDHCIKSPFTCLDWQKSKVFVKKPIKEVHQVRLLQPSYFFGSRRSLKEYLTEIKNNRISFREYQIINNNVSEVKKFKELDERHKIEFSYHIAKFLMINFLKLYHKNNPDLCHREIINRYFKIFPKNKKKHKRFIKYLFYLKEKEIFHKPEGLIKNMESFLEDFENQFKNYFYNNNSEVYFIRHAKTEHNKPNLFFGQRIDSEIINPGKESINKLKKEIQNSNYLFSSPMDRCINTLNLISSKEPSLDRNLLEIDYGLADGKTINYLKEEFPGIIDSWEFKEDPRFPQGENTEDVLERVQEFISKLRSLPQNKKIVVCSHSFTLKVLLGYYFKIPKQDWFKLNIPYFNAIKFILTKDNRFYIELSPEQIKEIFINF